jgi:acetyltransferase-like isoleucine patch superfamily enzyme
MRDDELNEAIRRLAIANDEVRRREFARSLPIGEGFVDRWERARRLGFGDAASIYDSAVVLDPVTVGEHTWIGPWVLLDGSGGGISIGAYCSISAGVHVYTHDTVLWALTGGAHENREAPTSIGDRCYVGPQSVIVAGVRIGTQCVVGANSFVNDSVADRSIVAGSPARVIGRVVGDDADLRIEFL